MRRMLLFFLMAIFSLTMVFPQAGNSRFVAVERLDVKSSSGFFAQDLGTLKLGDEVTLLRDSGRWSEVRAAGLSGWVPSASLSPRPTLRATSGVTPGEVALAGKGFSREVEDQYRASGLDFTQVDLMETMSIPGAELLQFIVDGQLSKGQ